ncbi:hypothetical protein ACFE04_017132 [Oxalis oulophora]
MSQTLFRPPEIGHPVGFNIQFSVATLLFVFSNGIQVLTSLQPLDYAVVAFLPGISEEFLFRGALLPFFGMNWVSVLLVPGIFGVLHLGSGRKVIVGYLLTGSIIGPRGLKFISEMVQGCDFQHLIMFQSETLIWTWYAGRISVIPLFTTIDTNGDGSLSAGEMKALIIGIQFEQIDLDKDDVVENIMRDFDITNDGCVEEGEFVNGITKWLIEARQAGGASSADPGRTQKYIDYFQKV